MAMDSIDSETEHPVFFNIVKDIDGQSVLGQPLKPWANAAPGEINHYLISFRNIGSIPFIFNGEVTGKWSDLPRGGIGSCPPLDSADNSLISIQNMYLHASDCSGSNDCATFKNSLSSSDSTPTMKGGVVGGLKSSTDGKIDGKDNEQLVIEANEYVIYGFDLVFDERANDCYQGGSFSLEIAGNATQKEASL